MPGVSKYIDNRYKIWAGIKSRCYNPNADFYSYYGGRGIKMCDKWRYSFDEFIKDIGIRPSMKHTLDRINFDGNYEPGNWRWATRKEQANNRSDNNNFEISGVKKSLAEWCQLYGVEYSTMWIRIFRKGWGAEKALTTPIQKRVKSGLYCGDGRERKKVENPNHRWDNDKCVHCGVKREKMGYERIKGLGRIIWHYGIEHEYNRPNCIEKS